MHLAKFYHKPSMFAYIVVPGCDTPGQVALELELMQEHLGIHPPSQYEVRRMDEGKHWGCSVIKIKMHPSIPLQQGDWEDIPKGGHPDLKVEDWPIIDDTPFYRTKTNAERAKSGDFG